MFCSFPYPPPTQLNFYGERLEPALTPNKGREEQLRWLEKQPDFPFPTITSLVLTT